MWVATSSRRVAPGAGDEQRTFCILQCLPYGVIVPERNVNFVGALHGLLPHRLTQAQCHSRRDVRHILAQDEHRIREFNFTQ